MIAQIDEHEIAMIAYSVNPAGKASRFSYVGGPQGFACSCSVSVHIGKSLGCQKAFPQRARAAAEKHTVSDPMSSTAPTHIHRKAGSGKEILVTIDRSMRRILLAILFATATLIGSQPDSKASDKPVVAFLEAVKAGDTSAVEAGLTAGIDVEAKDWAGWSALAWASLLLHNDIIVTLLDAGADIEYLSKGGKNSGRPLMMAAKKYKGISTVKLIVERGADVNGTDQYGRTALMIAARYGRKEIVNYLLDQGADPNAQSRIDSVRSALSIALKRNHMDVAAQLQHAGATQ